MEATTNNQEAAFQAERAKLAQIEAEQQQQTRARLGLPLEGETLPAYSRARAKELKVAHVAQTQIVTAAMLARPEAKVNVVGESSTAYAGQEDKRQR